MIAIAAIPAAAYAQTGSTGQQARAGEIQFNVPPQDLDSALTSVADQGGIHIFFTSGELAGLRSSGVSGRMTVEQALSQVLTGSGFGWRYREVRTVVIEKLPETSGAIQLGPVRVEGEGSSTTSNGDFAEEATATSPVKGYVARRSGTASKTDTAIIETPQAVSVITTDQMTDQRVSTISEALRYTSGVLTGQAGLQSRRFDPVFIRGIGGYAAAANFATYLDGMRWLSPARTAIQIDPWMLERIEVFKGPTSVLYGQAQPGGFVNSVSKRPLDTPHYEVFLSGGSFDSFEGGLDLTGPIDSDGNLLYRMVALGRTAKSFVDFQKEERIMAAPSLTWRMGDRTSLTLQGTYLRDPELVDAGLLPAQGTVLPNANGKLPRSRFQGDPRWGHMDRTQYSAGFIFQHSFDDMFSFQSSFRYGHMENDVRQITQSGLAANLRTLSRVAVHFLQDGESFTADNHLKATFSTGPIEHNLIVGVDFQDLAAHWNYGQVAASPLDIFVPDYTLPFTAPTRTLKRNEPLRQIGVYAQDQMAFGNWRLWLSGRHDWARTSNTIVNTVTGRVGTQTRNRDEAFTGRVGLLYLADNGLAPYVTYSTSFEPVTSVDYFGNAFKPMTGHQFEAGIKFEPPGSNVLLTAAVFHLLRKNVTSQDLDPTHVCTGFALNRCVLQSGELRSQGLELEGRASLISGLNLIGTYTYTDVKLTKSTSSVALLDGTLESLEGKRPVGVPKHMASAWLQYRPTEGEMRGIGAGLGVRYIGPTFGTESNLWNLAGFVRTPSRVPGYATIDASLDFALDRLIPALAGLRLELDIKNLADKQYVTSCDGYGNCTWGDPRTALVTLRYRW